MSRTVGPFLVLVKHALPQVDPRVPSRDWHLSEPGKASCLGLADRLAAYAPMLVVSSVEPKAIQTGQLVAARLRLPFTIAEGLHENDRTGFPFLAPEDYERRFASYFSRPSDVVIGCESAQAALDRFAGAVSAVEREAPDGTLVIAAHGTVISLLVASTTSLDPFQLWRELGLPSYVVLDRRTLALVAVARGPIGPGET